MLGWGACVIHCRGPGRRQRLCLQYIFCCALPVIRDRAFAGVRLIAIQSIFFPSRSIPFPPLQSLYLSHLLPSPLFYAVISQGTAEVLAPPGLVQLIWEGHFFQYEWLQRASRQTVALNEMAPAPNCVPTWEARVKAAASVGGIGKGTWWGFMEDSETAK